jgi:predicted flap endonuclease-1-like 5' DNA nuclease
MSDPSREPRQTLAMRLAERNRQRALRAERLARLRPEPADEAAAAGEALEEFLSALAGACGGTPAQTLADEPAPAAVLQFQRPEAEAAPVPADVSEAPPPVAVEGDLHLLPGMRPGLAWALARAGLARRADLAALEEADLVARHGPLGRLVPARAWLDAARGAAADTGA